MSNLITTLIAVSILPGMWLWMFIGGWVCAGVSAVFGDNDFSEPGGDDEATFQMFAAFWPLVVVVGLVCFIGLRLRHAANTPDKIIQWMRRGRLPVAKVVK